MNLRTIIGLSLVGTLALGGCTRATKALGITQIGVSSAENNYSQKSAREALIGNIDSAEPTRGEIVLMTKAGVGSANQEIRLEIDGQNSVERKSDDFTDRVLFWRDGQAVNSDGSPLDNEVEAARLKSINSATGGGGVEITRRPGGAKLPGL